MRTTLTIDPDVAIALERLRESRDLTLKAAVNEALRRGLRTLDQEASAGSTGSYHLRTWDSGGARVSLDSTSEALAWGEGEGWK